MANRRDISFATFNLYNLQRPGAPMYYGNRYSHAEYDAKIAWSAQQLKKLDADVIAFQELWSADALRDLFEAAGLSADYELVFIGDDWYSIAVAAAVRKPWRLKAKANHKAFPEGTVLLKRPSEGGEDDDVKVDITYFSRTVLELTINHLEVDDVPDIKVFAAHLKSKLETPLDETEREVPAVNRHAHALGAAISTIRRTAEAAALRVLLNLEMDGTNTPVVVLGDLNDDPASNTVAIVSDAPPFRLYEKSRTGWTSDLGLYSAGALQQLRSLRDVYYSYVRKGIRQTLDHVLVSEQFYDFSTDRRWSFKEARIWNDYLDDDDPATTDHGVMRAEFVWDPAG